MYKIKWAASWENRIFAYAKTKAQISFAVTAKLISAFVFATRIVYFFFFLYPKFQASSLLLWLYSPVCVRPCRKPRRPVFSRRGSLMAAEAKAAIDRCVRKIISDGVDASTRNPRSFSDNSRWIGHKTTNIHKMSIKIVNFLQIL